MGDYVAINKAMWDERAPVHAASAHYGFDRFIGDVGYLSGVVRFDRPRLGDLTGQRGVRLQCHIGTDTLSLARLGARMTGLDFSLVALTHARRLAQRTGTDIDFHEAEVYDAVDALGAGVLIWSTPESVRCAGCRTWPDGPASLLSCSARAVACSSVRRTPCCGR
jgi:hypothetical protein